MNSEDPLSPATGRLEELTVALNREIYAENAGLSFNESAMRAAAEQLKRVYRSLLVSPPLRDFALDGLAEAECNRWDLEIRSAMARNLYCPSAGANGSTLPWRDWKCAERNASEPGFLRRIFDEFVSRSEPLVQLIEARYSGLRQQYAEYGTTPLHVFARREGTTPADLRRLTTCLGPACGTSFRTLLLDLSRSVFGHEDVTVAELHALHNNRMYEPLAPLFTGREPIAEVRRALALLGFNMDAIALDCEERPGKYAGAFCLPVQVPGDVRISVRPVSAHHLEDMLFHEYGHAMHFASVDADLPFIDRYWIHSGTHETFATLFEALSGLPEFAREVMGFDESDIHALAKFARFKFLLTGTWLAAGAATVCDAWIDQLSWLETEHRLARYVEAFTGLQVPPAWARLDPFVSKLDPYAAGYVMASVRINHWIDELQGEWGDFWWANRRAGDSIRTRMRAGGRVRFEPSWLDPSAFARRWI
jgi:hypothetical protein